MALFLAKIDSLCCHFSIYVCHKFIHNHCRFCILLNILFWFWVFVCNHIVAHFQFSYLFIFKFDLFILVLFCCIVIQVIISVLFLFPFYILQFISFSLSNCFCGCQLGQYFQIIMQVLIVFSQFHFSKFFHTLFHFLVHLLI